MMITAAGAATALLWALLALGLAGSVYFLWTNRPAHPGLITVVTHGMPAAVALSFTRSIVLLVLRDGPRWMGAGEIVSSLATLALVDAVVLAVVLVWSRYRAEFQATARRLHDEDLAGR